MGIIFGGEQWEIWKAQRPGDAFLQFSGQQFRYGSRACLVISPYAKPGNVSTTIYTVRSHISLVKSVQTLLGIDTINPRLDTADDMLDCFDPRQAALLPPRI